jgi:hypothetical protein
MWIVEGQQLTNELNICKLHTYEKVEGGKLVFLEGAHKGPKLYICELHTYEKV